MPLQETSGTASYDGFGGGAPAIPNYIEDVFSTYLYTNNTYPSNLTITNGIDLSGKGGLVWMKNRNLVRDHNLYDTARGAYKQLRSDSIGGQITNASGYGLTAFNADGFSLGTDIDGENYGNVVSWTFRKQPKFFDVVTYTGNGANRTISHNLGSVPGCIIVKRTDTTGAWAVYHRSLANTDYLVLNTTAASATGATYWNSTTATSSVFSLGTATDVNANGGTYVAYLFAHNAGGFGAAGTDNVISCGSFTSDGAGAASVTLSYEPQWVLYKPSSGTGDWRILDNMRGWAYTNNAALFPNGSYAEIVNTDPSTCGVPTATGFSFAGGLAASTTYIYIAIRRGPMKTPTSGTSVYNASVPSSTSAGQVLTSGFPDDLIFQRYRTLAASFDVADRLRGIGVLYTTNTNAENTSQDRYQFDVQDGVELVIGDGAYSMLYYHFRRAPGFFDEVCFTATGSNFSVTHNLGTAPELVITKERNGSRNWFTYAAGAGNTKYLVLDGTASASTGNAWQNTTPTSTTLYLTGGSSFFSMGQTYVAYLFASCPGVSKVGSYTGNGSTQTINCGFTGGARFVIIKRTDSTGDWYTYDTARGMTSSTDPYLLLNSTAAETTGTDYVETSSTGFTITSTAPAAINANGGSFIFLAIA